MLNISLLRIVILVGGSLVTIVISSKQITVHFDSSVLL